MPFEKRPDAGKGASHAVISAGARFLGQELGISEECTEVNVVGAVWQLERGWQELWSVSQLWGSDGVGL